jgi:type I restriction enzyme S subunit
MKTSIKLGEVVRKSEENKWSDFEPLKEGFERFVKVEHMDPESLRLQRWGSIKDDLFPPTFHKIFRKGQILFPTRNPHLKRVVVATFNGICGEKTLTLTPIDDQIEPSLVPFIFQSDDFVQHCVNSIIGSTNPHVRWRDIAEYKVSLPEREVQKNIANLLWAIERHIEKNEMLLRTTEKLKKEMVEALLTKGIENTSSNDSEMGQIPAGWHVSKLSDLFQLVGGGTPKTSIKEFWNGNIPWISAEDIPKDGRYIEKTVRTITKDGLENSSTKLLDKGCIIISARGTVGLIGQLVKPMAFNQSCYGLVPNKGVDSDYLYYLMLYKVEELKKDAYGGVFNTITSKNFSYVKAALPSIDEQRKIVEILDSVFNFSRAIRDNLVATVNLRKKMTNSLISGEINLGGRIKK